MWGIRPHVAFIDDARRIPGLDQHAMRHASYALSQASGLIEQLLAGSSMLRA